MSHPESILIQDYTYDLPEDRIALHPLGGRDQSKLLVYQTGKISHANFSRLSEFLPADSILFFNNTKVIPARLIFKKETGAVIEVFLLSPISPSPNVTLAMSAKGKCEWHCTIGNLKKWNEHYELLLTKGDLLLKANLIDREKGIVEFNWKLPIPFSEVVQKLGAVPLPPYINRKPLSEDAERYQTVYSKTEGAVAAPTAGLHFTDQAFQALRDKKIDSEYLTLHVSAGTFQPVKVENATEHAMHSEQIVVTRSNIEKLLSEKRKVAVGTTSLRTMESIYWYGTKLMADPESQFVISQDDAYQLTPVDKTDALNAILQKMDREKKTQILGETSIYILPGYDFKLVDVLITNFHQPGSTLILLVAAFIGEDWRKIYEDALAGDYRFLSYGDSSLLFRS